MNSALFRKVLIANRGEIARRIMNTTEKLDIPFAVVYSDADEAANYVKMATEAVYIGASRPAQSYLNIKNILDAARQVNADAIHPGYGFLSENSEFAARCEDESIEFIGPPSEVIRVMASKSLATAVAEKAGVPVLPGYRGADQNYDCMIASAKEIDFPVLLKSALGGGGRGMRLVYRESEFRESLISAKSEAREAFGNDEIIIEKFLEKARHIEVQIAADKHGNCVHLFDRDCSAQRRYQKIVEEAPAPGIDPKMRNQMFDAAISVAKVLDYHSVGTVEFLFDGKKFYFMEMNTRLQVEHAVTEMVTRTDLVEWQLRIAAGESIKSLNFPRKTFGHSMEVRVYAENPSKNFLPSPGTIEFLKFPTVTGDWIQVHHDLSTGDSVDPHYDPLIGKIVVHNETRDDAIQMLLDSFNELYVVGVDTNVEFLSNLLRHPEFRNEISDIRFVESKHEELAPDFQYLPDEIIPLAALFMHKLSNKKTGVAYRKKIAGTYSPWISSNGWRLNSHTEASRLFTHNGKLANYSIRGEKDQFSITCGSRSMNCRVLEFDELYIAVEIDDVRWFARVIILDDRVYVLHRGSRYELRTTDRPFFPDDSLEESGSLTAPLSGRIVRVQVTEGDLVEIGDSLIVMEAMKMEHRINSPINGTVTSINYGENEQVKEGATCVVVEPIRSKNSTQSAS